MGNIFVSDIATTALGVVLIALIAAAVMLDRKRKLEFLSIIAKPFSARIIRSFFFCGLEGEYENVPFKLSIYPNGRRSETLRIDVESDFDFELTIKKKAFTLFVFNRLQLDKDFDYEGVAVNALKKNKESAMLLLGKQSVRESVKSILSSNADFLKIKQGHIIIKYDMFFDSVLKNTDMIIESIKRAVIIVKNR